MLGNLEELDSEWAVPDTGSGAVSCVSPPPWSRVRMICLAVLLAGTFSQLLPMAATGQERRLEVLPLRPFNVDITLRQAFTPPKG